MNLIPYILARQGEWDLLESSFYRDQIRTVNQHWDFLSTITSLMPALFRPVDLHEAGAGRLPGVYAVRFNQWTSYALRDGGISLPPQVQSIASVVRAFHVGKIESVLMFPDDTGNEPNLSIFSPGSGGGFVLHSLRFWLDLRSRIIKKVTTANDGGCTLEVRGEYPDRTFGCASTGCTKRCDKVMWIEENNVTTISCCCR